MYKRQVVFNGPDEQFVSGRAIGADGGIGGTYAVMPELYLKMDELIRANNLSDALTIQNKANAIIFKMCEAKGNLYACLLYTSQRLWYSFQEHLLLSLYRHQKQPFCFLLCHL